VFRKTNRCRLLTLSYHVVMFDFDYSLSSDLFGSHPMTDVSFLVTIGKNLTGGCAGRTASLEKPSLAAMLF